ncbi:putative rRNA processing protein Pwp1 [Talaromyces proteolyticus]|uniref:rRNA processing protein Pwp1 n=1 Tax=Talaromyces proteolyticus TaxID=1131652 RepID=A0AAD4Q0E1_9EURO|nr:putative rRNA processing protein Pwp1 [Talaromyces proteolyticus]KAH8700699.1 putative rRNA processing protein Pwp1 [Talaromyces proteolyticus]
MNSMITTTTWVHRGVAAQFPIKYDIDEEEINRISKLARLQLEDAKGDLEAAKEKVETEENDGDSMDEDGDGKQGTDSKKQPADGDDDDDLKEYELDHYDSDEVDEDGEEVTMFGNVKSLAYHQPGDKDPYLEIPEDDDQEDREELQILGTDNLLIAGKVEDEVAHLEVYVYEDSADNLYVHHDIMLPAIPLCTEWLDFPVGKNEENRSTGNFIAVGTMDPDIEIWDLDIVDCMYPNAILGQGNTNDDKPSKKKKKPKKANDEYHVDSVLALAANRQHRNLLASASADLTVKLWDLSTQKCAKSYTHHKDKVCALDWHPKESTVLLSGSYDRSIVAADMRTPEAKVARWSVASDVETVRWDIHDPNFFYVTTDTGIVYKYDVRNTPTNPEKSKPVWTLQAHDDSISSFDINPTIPGFLVTGSTDKQVKLWNTTDDKPNMVVSRKLEVGKIFSTAFAPDPEVSFRLAVAGSKGVIQIWDTSTNGAVRRAFAGRVPDVAPGYDGEVHEKITGVNQNDESDSSEGEDPEPNDVEKDGWESMEED